ncbi:MAG: CBS domain-containing protein [Bacteriovoracaceae bacterium]
MNLTKDVMSSKVICIKAEDSMVNAYKIMHEKGIRHLPVLDDRHSVVGILSDRDIQRAMSTKKINNFQQEVQLDGSLKVEDFMSWPVYAVSETTTVKKVAEEMLDQKVSAFLVEDTLGHLKGIVTTDDLLRLLIEDDENDFQKKVKLTLIGNYLNNTEAS